MAENRTLLSQEEIDALVSFLQDKKEVSMDAVLDQSSIDRIIELIQFNNDHGIYFDNKTPDLSKATEANVIDPTTGAKLNRADCVLECKLDESGFVQILVCDTKAGKQIVIGPACLAQKSFVDDATGCWGRAIAPKTLGKISNLFRIKYSTETMKMVTERFAEVMYGDKSAEIASVYLVPEIN